MLAERAGIGVDAAFARLRAYARNHNRRLSDVAREITDGRLNAPGSPTRSRSFAAQADALGCAVAGQQM